jgi:hypothetical protein
MSIWNLHFICFVLVSNKIPYIGHDDLEIAILLPQPPEEWRKEFLRNTLINLAYNIMREYDNDRIFTRLNNPYTQNFIFTL